MLLAELTAGAVEDARLREAAEPLDSVKQRASAQRPALDALNYLRPEGHIKVIAEVKRASPSRGEMATISDPADLARHYQDSGASTISVLTEGRRFKGSLEDLAAVKAAVSIPVLRKDFVATDYQVYEARAAGADLVLLIVAALEQQQLSALYDLVVSLGMTPLVEVHSADELQRVSALGARLIGVNARDLDTFELDRDLFGALVPAFPADAIRVAESAVRTTDDVAHYRAAGADVVLVGEALVTSDPRITLPEFLAIS